MPASSHTPADAHLPKKGARVALFVTCVVNVLRPQAARAAHALLRHAGFDVCLPAQSCCGQPAFNAGCMDEARAIARAWLDQFAQAEAIVAPSASCAGMVRRHFRELFEDDSATARRARALAARTFELCSFLRALDAPLPAVTWRGGPVLWHDSCASLREVPQAQTAALALLEKVPGLTLIMPDEETRQTCCGFGGLFSVKQPELSTELGRRKLAAMLAAVPGTADMPLLTGVDAGCLAHLQAVARGTGQELAVMHVAEILAGMTPADKGGAP